MGISYSLKCYLVGLLEINIIRAGETWCKLLCIISARVCFKLVIRLIKGYADRHLEGVLN